MKRFGAVSPSKLYITKLRWMVLCLAVCIVILTGALGLVMTSAGSLSAKQTEAAQAGNTPTAATQAPPAIPTAEVLVAKHRLYEGAEVTAESFESQTMPQTLIPEGTVLASEKDEVLGMFLRADVTTRAPLMHTNLIQRKPVNILQIPKGYRAVTITVDSRSAVEGFARPETRVDVLWFYTDDSDGKQKVSTLVHHVKVLSVGGARETPDAVHVSESTTATLLVSEKEARTIELARNLGSLSLSLVGEDEENDLSTKNEGALDAETVSIRDITGKRFRANKDNHEGVVSVRDSSGKPVKFVLTDEGWKKDSEAANKAEQVKAEEAQATDSAISTVRARLK